MKKSVTKTASKNMHQQAETIVNKKQTKPDLQLIDPEALKLIQEIELLHLELDTAKKELLLARSAAEEATQKYSDLYNFSTSGYFTLSREGIIIALNTSGASILGTESGLVKSRQFSFYVSDDTKKTFSHFLQRVFTSKTKESCEISIVSQDSQTVHVCISGIVNRTKEQCLLSIIDITRRIQAEETLIASESQYRNLANSGMSLIRTATADKLCNYFNTPWLNFTGRTIKQETGDGWTEGVHAEDIGRFLQTYSHAFDKHESFDVEYRLRHNSGEYRWINDLGTPNFNSSGAFIGYIMNSFDITHHKQTEQEMVNARKKAEESDRLKSAFLANMSHEIRTPMNGILGFTDLLKETNLTGEEQQRYIRIINESGIRMLNILNDIVSISKVESGEMKVTTSQTNINRQIEYIYTFFKPAVEEKGMELCYHVTLPDEEACINTDREKVYAILTNLVKNAIKFTQAGSINFGYEKKGKYLEFYVTDTGPGIRDDEQKIVFERFRQASESLVRNFEGAGLGLSISKAYVEKLGGKIWLNSHEGIGSTFYFTLPYNAQVEEIKTTDDFINDTEENHIHDLKILIAEDNKLSQMLISIAVEMYGKEIIKVNNGIKAVTACRNHPDIDLVLMDIDMPELNGYEATKQIRLFNKDIIIIAQTANALTGEREKVVEAGCNDYISKPFNQTLLRLLIQKYFMHKIKE